MGLLQNLIEQSRLPHGITGRLMLKIMNNAHKGLTLWGVEKLTAGKNVLDVSCGGGGAIRLLAESGKFQHVYGIDLSLEAVTLSTKYNQRLIDRGIVTIGKSSVLELPFEDAFFDAIVTFQSHYHWPNILQAVREIHKKLTPGGQFVLVAEKYKIEYHMKEYNTAQLTTKLLRDSGFRTVQLFENSRHICAMGSKEPYL